MSSSHLIRPDVDDVPLLANIAQILEQTDVTADPDEKMAIALQGVFSRRDSRRTPASATTIAIAGRKATICSACSRSLLSEGPVRQSQGSPIITCHMVVGHILGLFVFLRRDSSARSLREAGLAAWHPYSAATSVRAWGKTVFHWTRSARVRAGSRPRRRG